MACWKLPCMMTNATTCMTTLVANKGFNSTIAIA